MESGLHGDWANGLRAQLLLALLVLSVFPITLLYIPLRTDKVTLELAIPFEHGRWSVSESQVRPVAPAPPPPRGAIVEPDLWPSLAGRAHRLELTASDSILLDGVEIDLVGLRTRLDRLALTADEWVEIRPDPHSRYELFHAVVAVIARAGFDRLRLDHRRFAAAIDSARPAPARAP